MKVVLNRGYGCFWLSDEAAKYCGIDPYDADYLKRDNPKLVEAVEKLGDKAAAHHSKLKVIEFPDEATDWIINEYDGAETLIYVVDGKINEI